MKLNQIRVDFILKNTMPNTVSLRLPSQLDRLGLASLPGSLNRVPAVIGWVKSESHCVISCDTRVPVAVRHVSNSYNQQDTIRDAALSTCSFRRSRKTFLFSTY